MYSIPVVLVSSHAYSYPTHDPSDGLWHGNVHHSALLAGTGKSVLLREIIKTLRKKYTSAPDAVAITASTGLLSSRYIHVLTDQCLSGIAACNIGGVTIHSFGGIGLGIDSAEILVQKIQKNKKAVARWLRTKVLIIDEGQ